MGKMTETSPDGIEVYRHDINYYSAEYIKNELKLNPDDLSEDDKKIVGNNFVDMIFYIHDHIKKFNNDNIELLDNIFNIFVRLCYKFYILPTLECFGFLTGIAASTFSDWVSGQYRAGSAHGQTVKKWKDICKSGVTNRLSNQPGANANLIFIAKAAYGMVEAAQQIQVIGSGRPEESTAQIAQRYQQQIAINGGEIPDPDEAEAG